MTAADPFAHVRDERLRRLTAYWLGKRAGRLMPAPRDVDAVEIPALLPYLWIYDFLPKERRFRCRLAGDEVNMLLGLSLRGRYLEEIAPPVALPLARERFLGVVARHIARCRHDAAGERPARARRADDLPALVGWKPSRPGPRHHRLRPSP